MRLHYWILLIAALITAAIVIGMVVAIQSVPLSEPPSVEYKTTHGSPVRDIRAVPPGGPSAPSTDHVASLALKCRVSVATAEKAVDVADRQLRDGGVSLDREQIARDLDEASANGGIPIEQVVGAYTALTIQGAKGR